MKSLFSLFCCALLLAGCNSSFALKDPGQLVVDGDGDGFVGADDCDDSDDTIHINAEEVCGDGVDNNCNDEIDENVLTFYGDADADGYGASDATTEACEAPTGYVSDNTDCDDDDATISPDGTEICGGTDEDCDGTTDENGAADASTWFLDSDEDGFGDAASTATACEAPSGYVDDESDCDDSRDDVNPDANEVCDGETDEDCDETVDEADAEDTTVFYADADGDGFGDEDTTTDACTAPSGYVSDTTDCDDDDEDVNPDATELCNGYDDDCDLLIDLDDDSLDTTTTSYWWLDADGDGFGDKDISTESCEQPASGYVSNDEDCDDSDEDINPDAEEYCDGADDEDCDGDVDEDGAVDAETFYADADEDGFGDESDTYDACSVPSGYVDNDEDCDDTDEDISPDADEYCDGSEDEDCDGDVDENSAADADTFYADSDGDGYGDATNTTAACEAPTGYTTDTQDCDDGDEDINPDATEICDSVDNDCNGDVDDEDSGVDTSTGEIFYADDDDDGYGDALDTTEACEAPSGYVEDATDCDDSDADVSPGSDEVCEGGDEDCDGTTDENGAVDATTWYSDSDKDGYGDSSTSTVSCTQPTNYTDNDEDCDDASASINPGANEVCDSGTTDEDCDGSIDEEGADGGTTYYADSDGDGYGDATDTTSACSLPSDYTTNADDCDDSDSSISPAGTEACDGDDNDCDSTTDEGFLDTDGDSLANCVDPIVYEDDFGDTSTGDWSTWDIDYTSSWTHNGSSLTEDDGDAYSFHYLPEIGELDAYTISVDVAWAGSLNDEAGIVLGWDGATSGTPDYYLVKWSDPQGYYGWFRYGTRGRVYLRSCPNASCSTVDSDNVPTVSTPSSGYSSAQELLISVDGTSVDVYLDGNLEFSTSTSSHVDPDYIGLFSVDMDGGVEFDNFMITNDDA